MVSDCEEIVGQFPSPLLILQFSTTISEAIKQTVLSNVTYLLLKMKWVVWNGWTRRKIQER